MGFNILSLVVAFLFMLGLLAFVTDLDENKCGMTFMYEYPHFVKLPVSSDVQNNFPRYNLYAYTEGKRVVKVRKMAFSGIPVLFIPGNGGSHRQVRSLASIALSKSNDRPDIRFDFFAVDLNEELSALNGALLEDQTKFVNSSLDRILHFYQKNVDYRQPVNSVIVVGHSMGGVIAYRLAADPSSQSKIKMLIALSSPIRRPPIMFDFHMEDYYRTLNTLAELNNRTILSRKTLVSISGSQHDLLVNTDLTTSKYFTLNLASTHVPLNWNPADHLCIVWCNQLQLALARALFDSAYTKIEIAGDVEKDLTAIMTHHLVKNSGSKIIKEPTRYTREIKLSGRMEWVERLGRQYGIKHKNGTSNHSMHMIRIVQDDKKHRKLTLLALNLKVADWVMACPAVNVEKNYRYCKEARLLSQYSEIAPSVRHKRRTIDLDLFKLKEDYPRATHVVVRIPPTRYPVALYVDVHNPEERIYKVSMPQWYALTKRVILKSTPSQAIRYSLEFPELQHVSQYADLYLTPIKCSIAKHHAVVSVVVPWAYHNYHSFVNEIVKAAPIRLFSSKPINWTGSNVFVELTLDPNCQYSISIQNSLYKTLGQTVRHYCPMLFANVAAVLLMALRRQLLDVQETGRVEFLQVALEAGAKPYYLLTVVRLAPKLLSMKALQGWIPTTDLQTLAEEGVSTLVLPIFLYMTSVGLVYMIALGIWVGLVVASSTVNKIALSFLAKTVAGTFHLSDWVLSALHKVPAVVAFILVTISINACGALALWVGVVFYFLTLTKMLEDCFEEFVMVKLKQIFKAFIGKLFRRKKPDEERKEEVPAIKPPPSTELLAFEQKETKENEENEGNDEAETIEEKEETEEANQVATDESTEESASEIDSKEEELEEANEKEEQQISLQNQDLRIERVSEEPEIEREEENKDDDTPVRSSINLHITMFMIWSLIAILNVSYVLTWAYNFKYSTKLSPDLSQIYGLIIGICAIPLWQMEFPKIKKKWYKQVAALIYVFALLALLYAPLSIHRLSGLLSAVVLIVTLHQLFAPSIAEENQAPFDNSDKTPSMDTVKAKWE